MIIKIKFFDIKHVTKPEFCKLTSFLHFLEQIVLKLSLVHVVFYSDTLKFTYVNIDLLSIVLFSKHAL